MNYASSTSTVPASRPGTDPVFGQFGGVLRTTLRALRLQWHLYRAERRKAQAFEAISEMDAHSLRDIGAPDEMYTRAAERRRVHDRRGIPFGLSVLTVAIAVIATAVPSSATEAAQKPAGSNAHVQEQRSGVFTGEFVGGAPVYRFPSMVVTGSAKAKAGRARVGTEPRQARAQASKRPA